MFDAWRPFLYYALGFLPTLFFAARFILQWIQSEREKRSSVTALFWKLSLAGNVLLSIHYFIQFQYQFLLIQLINSFIAWRNLHFINKRSKALSLTEALLGLALFLGGAALLCLGQYHYTASPVKLFQAPVGLLRSDDVRLIWHIFGFLGALLFASRWWIQWLEVERSGLSRLTQAFWIFSIVGSFSSLIYFIRIHDWVNIVSYAFGLIPYLRNLVLIRRLGH